MFTSGLGAQLTWTLPFGLLIMFAVFNRFDRALGGSGHRPRRILLAVASGTWCCRITPQPLIGIGLFAFTLSYDEFARTFLLAGSD